MASDKTILQLPNLSNLLVSDVGVRVQDGTTFNFTDTQLVALLSGLLSLGSLVTFGTTIPTGGKNTDIYIKTNTNQMYQKISGTWTVIYTFPTAATGTSFRYGSGIPSNSLGINGDSYIDTSTGIFYLKSAGVYSQVFSMATGPAGPRGTSVLNGTVDPSSGMGVNGDFYLNTVTFSMFGPKTSGAWGSGTLLKIIPNQLRNGLTNPSNGLGIDNDFYLNTSNYTLFGPKAGGVWPAGVSIIGPSSIPTPNTITAGVTPMPTTIAFISVTYPNWNAVKSDGTYDYLYPVVYNMSLQQFEINALDDGSGKALESYTLTINP